MSAQINNNAFANIGRMFARQNVPALYGGQRSAGLAKADAASEPVDKVSLSALAPRPLSARFLEDAAETGRVLGEGGKLSADRMERLREDRVFSAMTVLAAVGEDGSGMEIPRAWPGGLPAPTSEEMEAARRRLAQRLHGVELADNPAGVQETRLELLRKLGKSDFSSFSPDGGVEPTVGFSG